MAVAGSALGGEGQNLALVQLDGLRGCQIVGRQDHRLLGVDGREEAGDESAILFETHALFVEDEDYVECIMNELEAEQCNIEHAVQTAGIQFAEMFANMDDAYMQARAADVRDVTQRILNNLMGIASVG